MLPKFFSNLNHSSVVDVAKFSLKIIYKIYLFDQLVTAGPLTNQNEFKILFGDQAGLALNEWEIYIIFGTQKMGNAYPVKHIETLLDHFIPGLRLLAGCLHHLTELSLILIKNNFSFGKKRSNFNAKEMKYSNK